MKCIKCGKEVATVSMMRKYCYDCKNLMQREYSIKYHLKNKRTKSR